MCYEANEKLWGVLKSLEQIKFWKRTTVTSHGPITILKNYGRGSSLLKFGGPQICKICGPRVAQKRRVDVAIMV